MTEALTTTGLETRRRLLDAVGDIAEILVRRAPSDEDGATLSGESIKALEGAGMFRLKLPACLGGFEADPTTQFVVLEALARVNSAASWCAMVGSTSVALPGAFLDDAAVAEIFPSGHFPLGASVAMPIGKTEIVDGGYLLSGRWPFASGVRHSRWITTGATVVRDGAVEHLMMTFPASSAHIHDNWQVAGLKGTGSCDISVDRLFVPGNFTWDRVHGVPRRGGPLYRIGFPGFVVNEHAGFALGLARRALDGFIEKAATRKRGAGKAGPSLAERHTVQHMIGAGDLRLRAARNLAMALNDEAWRVVSAGEAISPHLQCELRAIATYCTDVSLDVVTEAFRYSGGGAVYQKNILQQCLRDLNVAAQHLMVSDISYETLGQSILGFPDVNPMR
jgi:indole-3-acetate monooxygenase